MDVGLGLWTMRSTAAFPAAFGQLYADLVADARFAEALGFHSLWVAEHHFSPDGWCPAPLVAAAAVLGATTTLRVGSGIHLLPLYEPERAFAEVDWLHRLSGGRFDHGVGIGYRAAEYDGYGLSRKVRGRRMDAALEHFAQAGSEAPIWVGGMAEPALKRAARFGHNLLLPSTLTRAQTARAIESTDGTEADRRHAIEVHKAFTREYTAAWFPGVDSPEAVEAQLDRAIDTGFFGSAREVAAEVGELEALGVDLVVLHLVGDGRRPERHDAMRRIATELL
jgi:alkanesulfonate monooxygenase SsuD/methylene tetrahydromethanopterin reductase-like flavin-dependent oxidoreductase (luciferase family)